MAKFTRRESLALGLSVASASALPMTAYSGSSPQQSGNPACEDSSPEWSRGIGGQRKADLGNGYYLNPILAGDYADPSVLRDGDTYYMVFSSFLYYPGLVIWKSEDLVNWEPLGPALQKPVGSVFAPDLVKHEGRYYIYFPVANFMPTVLNPDAIMEKRPAIAIMVVHADDIEGPWSDPVDMGIYRAIDPGHVVGEDGKRYLFLSDGQLIPITDDGLSRSGEIEKVYEGWHYPDDWVVEAFALESPKLMKRDGWYYMFSAQGGTAGPPTSHMVVVARSRSVRGPWENCPHNPIVRTGSADELWWSRGHATPVQGPKGDWWMIYHGYENGFRTLGRQALLEPFEWDDKGWPVAKGGDLSRPLAKPVNRDTESRGVLLSDDFKSDQPGIGVTVFKPDIDYRKRITRKRDGLFLAAEGDDPKTSSPIVMNPGDRRYEVSVEIELEGNSQAGLLLFYNENLFCGIAADGEGLRYYKLGETPRHEAPQEFKKRKFSLRVVNIENVATFFYRAGPGSWTTFQSFDVSGYHHNIGEGFLNLRPALYATGSDGAIFRNLKYSGL